MPKRDLTLAIEPRPKTGTSTANHLRQSGKIPATLYGHGSDPQSIAIDARAFEDAMHHGGRSSLITLTLGGKAADTALLRDVQRDPVSRKVIHADLQRVSATETVHTELPIVTVGVARGVKEFGGVLDFVTHEVEIEGPANRIPDRLEIDVSSLGIHEHINASQVPLPEGFRMLTPPDTTIVSVEPSRTERELEEAAAGPAEQAEPEVIGATPTPAAEPE
ncbi:MAG: 50S ribosomal protein L25 [Candidatus Eremiobacteraeota bacterium]|nr:50S ribosomal protein L25 [Candidatus Eremiobacteraeota bacterium]